MDYEDKYVGEKIEELVNLKEKVRWYFECEVFYNKYGVLENTLSDDAFFELFDTLLEAQEKLKEAVGFEQRSLGAYKDK